jgi:hypothetical protein
VIDFDQVVRDWADPNLTSAPFNCGDHSFHAINSIVVIE